MQQLCAWFKEYILSFVMPNHLSALFTWFCRWGILKLVEIANLNVVQI